MRNVLRITAFAGLGLALAACTSLRSQDDTFSSVQDLRRWSCLGHPQPQSISSPPPITYTTNVVDWVTNMAPPGLQICVCAQVDVPPPDADGGFLPCRAPLGGCPSGPDSSTVNVPLPGRGDLYMAFITPSTVPDALYFNRPPMGNLTSLQPPIRLITFGTAQSLAESFGLQLDPNLGLVVMRIFDCNGSPAPGVKVTLQPAPPNLIPFAYQNDAPSPLLTVTDETGQFGFGNASPGSAKATVILDDAQQTMIASVTFTVRAGWATLVDVRQ
jgi:hypothetical protein